MPESSRETIRKLLQDQFDYLLKQHRREQAEVEDAERDTRAAESIMRRAAMRLTVAEEGERSTRDALEALMRDAEREGVTLDRRGHP